MGTATVKQFVFTDYSILKNHLKEHPEKQKFITYFDPIKGWIMENITKM